MIHYYFALRKGTIEFSLFKKGKYLIYVDLNVLFYVVLIIAHAHNRKVIDYYNLIIALLILYVLYCCFLSKKN